MIQNLNAYIYMNQSPFEANQFTLRLSWLCLQAALFYLGSSYDYKYTWLDKKCSLFVKSQIKSLSYHDIKKLASLAQIIYKKKQLIPVS